MFRSAENAMADVLMAVFEVILCECKQANKIIIKNEPTGRESRFSIKVLSIEDC